ncbi:MAG: DUF3644 domain-containing protein [Planctomycetes bacterium]|nr:DUF3644 domain-containing protein [Planctomycetota bacterium]
MGPLHRLNQRRADREVGEAALGAIRVFNDPLTKFKSQSYIVLMVIAWTYLLHAYYQYKDQPTMFWTCARRQGDGSTV